MGRVKSFVRVGKALWASRRKWSWWKIRSRYNVPLPFYQPGPLPLFRKKAQPGSFELRVLTKWNTYDLFPISGRTYALYDSHDHLRFVLNAKEGHNKEGKATLDIAFIQREYSTPARQVAVRLARVLDNHSVWNRIKEIETRENKEWSRQLGCHPAEFLLCEFLYRNRVVIRGGMNVRLFLDSPKIYGPLYSRFFGKQSGGSHFVDLGRKKQRVRDALGLPPLRR
ncbi:MAG: hypothetical protein V1776_05160 [Candidatus Diapherotrites archaeon]